MIRSVVLLCVLAACPRHDTQKTIEPSGKHDAQAALGDGAVGELPPAPPVPRPPLGLPAAPDIKATPELVALGELLFWDPRLSTTGKLACASCHDPAHGFSGGNDATAAGKPNLRRTPPLVDLAWQRELGWDGRYASLDDLMTAHVRGQLGQPLDGALRPLLDLPLYRAEFARAASPAGGGDPAVTAQQALEAYVLTRFDADSPWDRLEPTVRTPKPGADADPVVAGYLLFVGKARCATCHPPPLYTDLAYHHVVANAYADKGRGLVDPKLDGAFKTPTLRGAAARTKFFHTGAVDTLAAAIAHPELEDVHLSPGELERLRAFLEALTHEPASGKPALP